MHRVAGGACWNTGKTGGNAKIVRKSGGACKPSGKPCGNDCKQISNFSIIYVKNLVSQFLGSCLRF